MNGFSTEPSTIWLYLNPETIFSTFLSLVVFDDPLSSVGRFAFWVENSEVGRSHCSGRQIVVRQIWVIGAKPSLLTSWMILFREFSPR